jgi:hypothetical protein
MKDWKQILYEIYSPEIGSLWASSNKIWNNSFATNKEPTAHHPSVVGNLSSCKTNYKLVPGTSKNYRTGSCVFRLKLKPTEPNYPISYFLIDLWMTLSKSDLLNQTQGWDGVFNLDSDQLKAFKMQIKFCNGIDV